MTRLLGVLLVAVLAVVLGLPSAPANAGGDPRWVFYTKDKTYYTSPWFAGAHRIMVPFGCTTAPYYSPDPRCADDRGFHHGLDIAMKCGTRLFAAKWGRVVSNDELGPAYGDNPLLMRNTKLGYDVLIAHARKVFVHEGDRVKPGTPIARASDSGAPDGCHLHFEKRAVGGGLDSAVWPRPLLDLTPNKH